MIQLSELKPNDKNPRLMKDHRFVKLLNSIQSFPEMLSKRKIIVSSREDKTILAGTYRFFALKKLGYKEISDDWVDYADDWTEEQKKEFKLKDNIHMGEWNIDMLANEFDEELLSAFGLDDILPAMEEEMAGKHPDSNYNNYNCEYPIIPEYDEKYEAIVVICRTQTEISSSQNQVERT